MNIGFIVICLSPDVSQNVHCEAVMRRPEWQAKVVRNGKNFLKSSLSAVAAVGGVMMKTYKMKKGFEEGGGGKKNKKMTQGILKSEFLKVMEKCFLILGYFAFTELKKTKSKSRKLGKYSELYKHKNNKKMTIKTILTLQQQNSHISDGGYGQSQEFEAIPRSKNSSPIPSSGYNRYDR